MPPLTPRPIQLNDFRLHGVAAANVLAGGTVPIMVRAEMTSDDPQFHRFMQSISNLLTEKARASGVHVLMDGVARLLLVTHDSGTADLYLHDFPVEMEIMPKHNIAKGDAVFPSSIADVRRLRVPWLQLDPRDGLLCCFKVGWKFALFFDLDPPVDVDEMQRSMGKLYRGILFEGVYEALESEPVLAKIISAGWFPFVETIGGEFERLLQAYKEDFNVAEETGKLIARFDATRIESIAQRWWAGSLLSHRKVILDAALEAFKRGDAVSCLKNLLTEIEGLLQDAHIVETGKGVKVKELLEYAFNKGTQKAGDPNSLLFPSYFLSYLLDYTYAYFDPKKPDADVMSRHSAGHGGAAAAAYTLERALQAILTVDQLNFYY